MVNVIISEKSWHDGVANHMAESCGGTWIHIKDKAGLTAETLAAINPTYVFIPHWSHIIDKEIYENYNCIIFHMTDVPYGRGGSPLQNLIARGHTHTKISAIQCGKGIDSGDVYLKCPLRLNGTAREILERFTTIIEGMIYTIVTENLTPTPQEGLPTIFRRRKKDQSNIAPVESLDKLYDLVRMLDCEGYPAAFLNTRAFHIEFREAMLCADELHATVIIRRE